jgi:Protein of unknown function (DUF559)
VIYQRVYALGHPWLPIEGRLVAALLHTGADAVLSHTTAAWWWGVVPDQPDVIDVSTLTRARSLPDLRVHHPRTLDATRYRRFPVTTVPRTLLDLASQAEPDAVRQALAEADYRRLLNPEEVKAILGQGRPGSAKLRKALDRHLPRLALTRFELERRFLALCERAGLPLPEVNARVSRMTVDALWRGERLAVELDGYEGHRSRAQTERDHRRDLQARMAGFVAIRYTWRQINDEPDRVAADLQRQLSSSAPSA